jgi:hypothetical protein
MIRKTQTIRWSGRDVTAGITVYCCEARPLQCNLIRGLGSKNLLDDENVGVAAGETGWGWEAFGTWASGGKAGLGAAEGDGGCCGVDHCSNTCCGECVSHGCAF